MPIVGNNQVGRALPNIGFFGSQSWTPAYDLQAYVYVIGAGGSGARTGGGNSQCLQGGAAGGCAVSFLTLLSSVTYTITIGAGGAVTSGSGNGNGNAGGNSSLAGSNITTMTGNGGAAGTYASSGTIAANAGGSASGGNICNNTGGSGGLVSDTNNHMTGGGAVGLWTTGNSAEASSTGGNEARGGGTLNYDNDSLPASHEDYYSWYYSNAGMNILSPFPALFTSQNIQFDSVSNSTSYDAKLQANFLSGQFATGWRSYDNGHYKAGAAGPFCGGWAMSASTAFAGGGGLGGGGGSARGGGTGYAGGGGSGGVLIFPVDMG